MTRDAWLIVGALAAVLFWRRRPAIVGEHRGFQRRRATAAGVDETIVADSGLVVD